MPKTPVVPAPPAAIDELVAFFNSICTAYAALLPMHRPAFIHHLKTSTIIHEAKKAAKAA